MDHGRLIKRLHRLDCTNVRLVFSMFSLLFYSLDKWSSTIISTEMLYLVIVDVLRKLWLLGWDIQKQHGFTRLLLTSDRFYS
jgi:hypothetical protein